MTIRFICADVMAGLAQLPDESVHCVVTSPPYFGLRSYLPGGHPDKALEIGSEPTLAEHIAKLVEVLRQVRRVLRKDGTLWLNYGDMWAGGPGAGQRGAAPSSKSTLRGNGHVGGGPKLHDLTPIDVRVGAGPRFGPVLKPKDLCMAPHRLAIALQDDGWWVRSDIVWHKPNPMPSSVTDRPTPAKEYVFLLSKSAAYFYDAQAIAEPASWQPGKSKMPDGWDTGPGGHGSFHRQGREKGRPTARAVACKEGARPPGTPPQTGMSRQWDGRKNETTGDRRKHGFNGRWDGGEADGAAPATRNCRDVWVIPTEPFPDAHYATFPSALAERCVKAGTSAHGCCTQCGAPWVRQTVATFFPQPDVSPAQGVNGAEGQKTMDDSNGWDGFPRGSTQRETLGWALPCEHGPEAGIVPAVVLDPFGGSGTVGMVADRLGRDAVLIDIDPVNKEMAEKRIARDRLERKQGTMADVTAAKLPPTPLEALMQEGPA
jgi:site-specific DNA-methyltransferase (cytosine-N4-specific)